MKQAFTKADSAAVKGAAILMMMFHHLYLPGRFDDYAIDFWPIGENLVASMAWKCKICVSLFAFITGYGLLSSLKHSEKGMEHLASWTRVRLVKTMSGFWFIYAMAFAVTLCLDGLPLHQYGDKGVIVGVLYALADACGLANLFGSPTLCSTWWYMSAAIVFIVLFPILYAIAHRFGYIAAIVAVMAVPRLIGGGYPGGTNAITFVFPLLMGMMFSDLSLFERLDETTTRKSHAGTISLRVVPVCILTVIALLVPNSFRVQAWELNYGIVPVIVICFLRYCIIPIPGINAVLRFLGRHSMTIFLTHTFIRATYCEDFVYGTFDNFLAVYALLLVMSLALALAIDGLKKVCRYDHLVNRMIDRMNDALACDVGGKRIEWLDSLKGILILLVVFGHVALPVREGHPTLEAAYNIVYLFHMPLFVFMSGLLAKRSLDRTGRLRIERVLDYLLLAIAFNVVLRLIDGGGLSLGKALLMPGAPWYLAAMAIWILLTPILAQLRPVAGLTLAVLVGVIGSMQIEATYFLGLGKALHFLPYFVLGYYATIPQVGWLRGSALRRIICCLAGAAAAGAYLAFPDRLAFITRFMYGDTPVSIPVVPALGEYLVMTVLGLMLAVAFVAVAPAHPVVLAYLGRRTLAIYIVHRMVKGALDRAGFFDSVTTLDTLPFAVCLLGAMAVACAIALIPPLPRMLQSLTVYDWSRFRRITISDSAQSSPIR